MKRSVKQWSVLFATVIITLMICIVLEYLSVRYNRRYNLTGNLKYELTERTKKIIKNLNDKLLIIYFGARDKPETDLIRRMLELYTNCSHKIRYKVVDPKRNPMLVKRYNVGTERVAILLYKGKKERVIVESERDLTNAILRLSTKKMKVYFLVRDGEYQPFEPDTIYTKVGDLLEEENYTLALLKWKRHIYIPHDADLIIIWRPKKEFDKKEIQLLYDYLKNGGKLLFMLEPFTVCSLNKFFSKFGVEINNEIIVDRASRLVGGDMFMPMIEQKSFGKSPIVNSLTLPIMLPMARPIYVKEKPRGEIKTEVFLKTSSWSWTVPKEMYDKWEFEYKRSKCRKGPIPVGIEVWGSGKGIKGKMIIIGSADFATNPYIDIPGLDNAGFFMNIVEWLCRGENLIGQRPAPKKFRYRPLKETERKQLLYLIILMPMIVLFIGTVVYLKIKRTRI